MFIRPRWTGPFSQRESLTSQRQKADMGTALTPRFGQAAVGTWLDMETKRAAESAAIENDDVWGGGCNERLILQAGAVIPWPIQVTRKSGPANRWGAMCIPSHE